MAGANAAPSTSNLENPVSISTEAAGFIDKNGGPLLVLKVGTSTLLVSDTSGYRVQLANVAQLVELIAALKREGYRVVLVSSGAVGMGCIKLDLSQRPTTLAAKQAVAAAGQSQLMRLYEDMFGTAKVRVAQILISQSDFMEKHHWSNVKNTINECLNLGLVPIINENDSTNTEELRFGDNDNLAALTAVQLAADGLFMFTDVDYLYTANPRVDPSATPLRVVNEPWALNVDTRAAGSGLGTGGMTTKILAARTVSAAGIPCGLINGAHVNRVNSFLKILFGSGAGVGKGDADIPVPDGTYFKAMDKTKAVDDQRRWILSLPISGELVLDDGAARATANKKSLLPVGIVSVQGRFMRYESVRLVHRGREIGRALVNFSSDELEKIRGHSSLDFGDLLGYATKIEACYRANIILTVEVESLQQLDVAGRLPQTAN